MAPTGRATGGCQHAGQTGRPGRRYSLLAQASRLGGLALASAGLGLAREYLIAQRFGASTGTDAFLVALSVPSLLYAFCVGEGLPICLIPKLAPYFNGGDQQAGEALFASFFTRAALAGVAGVALIETLARPLVGLFAPGIHDPATAVAYTRWLAPLFLVSVAAYSLAGYQCSRNRSQAWGRIAVSTNGALVICVLLLAHRLGVPALVVGALLGGLLGLALLFVGLPQPRWRGMPRAARENRAGGRVLLAMLPFALVLGVGGASGTSQADIFLVRHFAAPLAPGSITLLALGNKLMGFPAVVIGLTLGLTCISDVAAAADRDGPEAALSTISDALVLGTLLATPAFAALFCLSGPIVGAVFAHTSIRAGQILELGRIVRAYSGATVGLSLVYILGSALAAFHERRAMIAAGLLTIVAEAMTMSAAVGWAGATGIAWCITAGSFFCAGLMTFFLTRRGRWRRWPRRAPRQLAVVGLAPAVGAAAVWVVRAGWPATAPPTARQAALGLAGAGAAAGWLLLTGPRLGLGDIARRLRQARAVPAPSAELLAAQYREIET